MKICSTLFRIKECYLNTIFHFSDWQNCKTLMKIYRWHGFLHTGGGNINWYGFFSEPFGNICQNVKYKYKHKYKYTHTPPLDLVIPLPVI